jgi:hypothetical protein
MKAPNSKHQAAEKLQASSFKRRQSADDLVFGVWNFSGAWMLVLGIFSA